MKKVLACLVFCTVLRVPEGAAQSEAASVWSDAFGSVTPGCAGDSVNAARYSVAKIEFADDGSLHRPEQLRVATDCIRAARGAPSGAVVLMFIHGWNHNAAWDPASGKGDEHFRNFRAILQGLAYRETERNAGRSVVGIYAGWNGNATKGLGRINSFFSFWNRYKVARRIGESAGLRQTVRELILATKDDMVGQSNTSPLLLSGHSMGAMMLELSVIGLLRDESPTLRRPVNPRHCAVVRMGSEELLFPDLILFLNSAADANVAKRMKHEINLKSVKKTISCGEQPYQAPLILSATATKDRATGMLFRLARPGQRTEGHDRALATHSLVVDAQGAICEPLKVGFRLNVDESKRDFGQSWHCLREPEIQNGVVKRLTVDLPQQSAPRDSCHVRHQLKPIDAAASHPFWIFEIPEEVSGAHSDIFNARSNLLMMGFAQAAGAIMSLADSWDTTFELEQGTCELAK